ncbi:hypothetical protein E4U26_007511 [Claviceps purpurea]|nr:hypothetical protein E4U26_007511 [Claviceps purpurea]
MAPKDLETGLVRPEGPFKYPRSFAAFTTVDKDACPTLARPDEGDTFVVIVDNRWTVPYTLYLLSKFRAHINAEGNYRANIHVEDRQNEIELYVKSRYVTAGALHRKANLGKILTW